MINPDAIFRDSKLWSSEVREERAKAHGIPLASWRAGKSHMPLAHASRPVDQVEDFYRRRTLLKATVTAEDVAEAALFLAGDRSLKTTKPTGAMLPVDGHRSARGLSSLGPCRGQ